MKFFKSRKVMRSH